MITMGYSSSLKDSGVSIVPLKNFVVVKEVYTDSLSKILFNDCQTVVGYCKP